MERRFGTLFVGMSVLRSAAKLSLTERDDGNFAPLSRNCRGDESAKRPTARIAQDLRGAGQVPACPE